MQNYRQLTQLRQRARATHAILRRWAILRLNFRFVETFASIRSLYGPLDEEIVILFSIISHG